ncbi:alpha/beta fold hydrolase [Novosphingobium rosa]|uniref:alpha/beta fold hydrolase n=1 Tax=Novosphingobium rosa TaxID=76978 RepID=UPI00082B4039|nr:alpha/beta hydrolase [Novosphingobium rosa]
MPDATQPRSRHIVSQSLQLHYLEWGDPDAPVLILQHGGFDHARSMDWIAREFSTHWRVICPDLRGHGDSDWSPDSDYTLASLLLDFANLVEALGQETVTICAHSLGAIVTTRYAGLYPEKVARYINIEGLTLAPGRNSLSRIHPYAARVRGWIDRHQQAPQRAPRRYPGEEAAFSRMRDKNPYLTDDQVRHLTHHALRRNEDGTFSWKFDPRLNIWSLLDFPEAEVIAMWEAITCPVLFFHGSNTFMPNPGKDGRIRHFRDARLIEYAQASHWLHHDRLSTFIEDVKAFLEGE